MNPVFTRSFFEEETRRHNQTYFFLVLGVVWMAIMACLIVDAHAGLFRQFGNPVSQAEVRYWWITTSCLAIGLWGLVTLILLTLASRVLPLLMGAHHARGMDEQVLGNVAQEIGIAAAETPSNVGWYILEAPDRNAFACGRSVSKGSIVVTRGLLECLNRNELQAVVADELAHLKNGDSQFTVSALAFAWMVIGVVSPLWLDNPPAEKVDKITILLLSFLLHTHPGIERRIELLRDMAGSTALTEPRWLAAIRPSTSQRINEWALPIIAVVLAIAAGVLLIYDLVH